MWPSWTPKCWSYQCGAILWDCCVITLLYWLLLHWVCISLQNNGFKTKVINRKIYEKIRSTAETETRSFANTWGWIITHYLCSFSKLHKRWISSIWCCRKHMTGGTSVIVPLVMQHWVCRLQFRPFGNMWSCLCRSTHLLIQKERKLLLCVRRCCLLW